MGTNIDFIRLLRVKQWLKNGFVLVPLFFSLEFMNMNSVTYSLFAFLAFCFASSSIYIINDIIDRKADALYGKKSKRPIASGKISISVAVFFCLLCLITSLALMFKLSNEKVALCISLYIILNLLYSIYLKNISIVDIFCIAFGFVLRVFAGSFAIGVETSGLLFIFTLFLSLFLASSKRKAELIKHGSKARKSLSEQSVHTLEKFQVVLACSTIVSYALYTITPSIIIKFGDKLIYSIIFIIFGIFRYIEQSDKSANYEDPTDNLYNDKVLAICIIMYLVYLTIIISTIIFNK
jgi:4-hydroxybenzoate polyprenyltransferase